MPHFLNGLLRAVTQPRLSSGDARLRMAGMVGERLRMDGREQLGWVQKNLHRQSRVRGAGQLMVGIAQSIESSDVNRLADVASALAELVDDQFQRHCRLESVRNGRLVVNVDERSLVYAMRSRWYRKIMRELPAACRGVPVGVVMFKFGVDGQPICVSDTGDSGQEGRGGN